MRETIGSTWVYQLVIIFILIFASYLTISISYSKVFKIKNEVLNIIEKNEGFTSSNNGAGSIAIINNYLYTLGYNNKGVCQVGYLGAKSLQTTGIDTFERVNNENSRNKYYYCINKITNYSSVKSSKSIYKIDLFFDMDLPVIGHIITFTASGTTSEIEYTYDSNLFNYK